MKIVVIINKYGEQINLSIPTYWEKKDIFANGEFGNVTQKFIDYFEKETNKDTYDNLFYFEHVFYVDISKDIINYQTCQYDERDELIDYPHLGIGAKPGHRALLTDEQLENIIGG